MSDVRQQYRELTEAEATVVVRLKNIGQNFLDAIDDMVPTGREASLARTKVEEAVMWAVKGVTK